MLRNKALSLSVQDVGSKSVTDGKLPQVVGVGVGKGEQEGS